MLRKALDSPARATVADVDQLRIEWERIRTLVGTRRTKMQAPPRVVPANPPGLADGVELLAALLQPECAVVRSSLGLQRVRQVSPVTANAASCRNPS